MYIKSVVIDGFKSFGRRTEIHGFDKEFNAITGLNGTGKSNILESICFALGINNLGNVRAGSLQDLVYKCGQAGITKATVTLVFDNTDPNQCPLGYEKCREISVTRQIAVGGKNKYLVNGKLVQKEKVSDIFCAVQLNVNNPNFLITQGRIVKVLNMNPQEILSMIEEATGTSLYETKREATIKLMEKKDTKVPETNALLQEEIEKKTGKTQTETAAYLEFQKICREIEYLTRIYISFRYIKKKIALKTTEANIEGLTNHIEHHKKTVIDNDKKTINLAEVAEKFENKIENESGGELKVLEDELETKIKAKGWLVGHIKATQGAIGQEERKVKSLEKSIRDDENDLNHKVQQMQKVEGLFLSLKEADQNDSKAYADAQKKFVAATQGLSIDEYGQASSLQDKLINAQKQLSEVQTTIKTSGMELRHSRKLLQQKENETPTNDASYMDDKKMQGQIEAEIKNIMGQSSRMDYQEGTFEQQQERKNVLVKEIRNLEQQLDSTNAYRYELQYRDPEPNFDRGKVHGMVGKLFSVRDEKNCLALMMSAGGSLYSHVADDDITIKKIFLKGQLEHRVTIIPINKISSHPIDPKVVRFAQKLVGAENVNSALSLIEYDRYFDPVMKFIFGHTLICKDLNIAKQVTYHPKIHCRSVTLEGDVVNPKGPPFSCSKSKCGDILQELAEIKRLEIEMRNRKNELQQIDQHLSNSEKLAKAAKERMELRQHELNACVQRLAQTSFQQHQKEIESLKGKIVTLEKGILRARDIKKSATIKVKVAQNKLADAKGHHERELKAATEEMQVAKKKSEESYYNWNKHEQEYQTLLLEIDDLKKSPENSRQEREQMIENVEKLKSDFNALKSKSSGLVEVVAEAKMKIKQQKEKMNSQSKQLLNAYVKVEKSGKQTEAIILEIEKKEIEIAKLRKENKDSFNEIKDLEDKYDWIKEDREFFGTKNTRYDYSKEDPVEAGVKLNTLREQKDKMEGNLNLKAMRLLYRQEEQYQETLRRQKIVEQDKEKVQNIICKVDEQKKVKVEKAWKVVDENFSSIFTTLLPGAQARLNPVMQSNSLLGLEIKVEFNGEWKESLSELSGDQRSLVALSLVLAMLKFSPAPLYILDEIDTPFDMSHTQNIGNMLKTHFSNSQFIVVSLKDGIFNNANVLFRTQFEEGVSAVTRTVKRRNIRSGT